MSSQDVRDRNRRFRASKRTPRYSWVRPSCRTAETVDDPRTPCRGHHPGFDPFLVDERFADFIVVAAGPAEAAAEVAVRHPGVTVSGLPGGELFDDPLAPLVELGLAHVPAGDEEHAASLVACQPDRPLGGGPIDARGDAVGADCVQQGEFPRLLARTAPDGRPDVVVAAGGPVIFRLGVAPGGDQDVAGFGGLLDDRGDRVPGLQVSGPRPEVGPPGGGVEESRRDVPDSRPAAEASASRVTVAPAIGTQLRSSSVPSSSTGLTAW